MPHGVLHGSLLLKIPLTPPMLLCSRGHDRARSINPLMVARSRVLQTVSTYRQTDAVALPWEPPRPPGGGGVRSALLRGGCGSSVCGFREHDLVRGCPGVRSACRSPMDVPGHGPSLRTYIDARLLCAASDDPRTLAWPPYHPWLRVGPLLVRAGGRRLAAGGVARFPYVGHRTRTRYTRTVLTTSYS